MALPRRRRTHENAFCRVPSVLIPPPLVVDEATGGRLEAAVDAIPGGVAEGCFMSMTFSRIGMTNRGKTGFFYSQEGTNQ